MKLVRKPYFDLVYPADQFVERPIPPREWLLDGAIPHPGVGMVYAWRGSGKTFTALTLALAVARGEPWMLWQSGRPRPVLYVDGEMPLSDLRERLAALCAGRSVPHNLLILASEDLAVASRSLNLALPADRAELAKTVEGIEARWGYNVELIILDNWVSLVRGIDENDNSSMDAIKEWLILMRHGEKSVLIIHHSGKGGGQRGGSAREDILDYSAKLAAVRVAGPTPTFSFEWDKARRGMPQPPSFTMELLAAGDTLTLRPTKATARGRAPAHDHEILAALTQGPQRFTDIVTTTSLHKQQVTRALVRLAELGQVLYENGYYSLVTTPPPACDP